MLFSFREQQRCDVQGVPGVQLGGYGTEKFGSSHLQHVDYSDGTLKSSIIMATSSRHKGGAASLDNSIGLDMIYEEDEHPHVVPNDNWQMSGGQMSATIRRSQSGKERRGKRSRMHHPGAEFKLITQKLMELQRK